MKSKTVLVTGASGGFGLLTSVELARRGHRVFASMRNLEKTNELRQICSEAGVQVQTIQLDVTQTASIEAAIARVVSQAGSVDVLVNNAGINTLGFFEDL